MKSLYSIIKRLCIAAGLLTAAHMPAPIYNFYVMYNTKTGNTIYLFSDFHRDLNNLQRTMMQVNELTKIFVAMPEPKEIIVEDWFSLKDALEERVEGRGIQRVIGLPLGYRSYMIRSSVLGYAAFAYAWKNVPSYNVEFREFVYYPQWSWAKIVRNMFNYDDGPVLNEHYATILREIRSTQNFASKVELMENELLEIRILHRLYNNALKGINNQVVLAGGSHIAEILPILKKLGYQQILFQGMTTEYLDVLIEQTKVRAQDLSFLLDHPQSKAKKKKILQQIDALYQEMMDKVTTTSKQFQMIPKIWESQKASKKPQPAAPAIKSRL